MLAKSFSQVRTEAEESWEKLLSKIRVIGGTEEEKETFYSTFTARSYGPFFLVMQMENLWMQMEIP